MIDIKNLNINHMLTMMALKRNDFFLFPTSLDLNTTSSNVSRTMKLIESFFPYSLFIKGDKKYFAKGKAVIGFTVKGQDLYFSMKTLLSSIMLIDDENANN